MKNEFIKIAKEFGFTDVEVVYTRPDFSAVAYTVFLVIENKTFKFHTGYFIGETGTANSKSSVIPDFKVFLSSIKSVKGGFQ